MKKRVTPLLAALLAALLFSTIAHADAINSPDTAPYISALPQSIPANSTQWYKFDYVGDKSRFTPPSTASRRSPRPIVKIIPPPQPKPVLLPTTGSVWLDLLNRKYSPQQPKRE